MLETIWSTFGVLLIMAVLSSLCCLYMKCSDLMLRHHIKEMAKEKGIKLDLDKLDKIPKRTITTDEQNEHCLIMIAPDIAIVAMG